MGDQPSDAGKTLEELAAGASDYRDVILNIGYKIDEIDHIEDYSSSVRIIIDILTENLSGHQFKFISPEDSREYFEELKKRFGVEVGEIIKSNEVSFEIGGITYLRPRNNGIHLKGEEEIWRLNLGFFAIRETGYLNSLPPLERRFVLDHLSRRLGSYLAHKIDGTIDGLTGLWNRREFDDRFRDIFERAGRLGKYFSLLIIDVDDFKRINDTLGHSGGDYVLQEIARRAKRVVRGSDIVCRYGGDEIAVLLPGADETATQLTAERIREEIRKIECGTEISVSIGTRTYDGLKNDSTPEEMLKGADQNMYYVKLNGKDGINGGEPVIPS